MTLVMLNSVMAHAGTVHDAASHSEQAAWPGLVVAGLVVAVVLLTLWRGGALRRGVLQRGPERWLELTVADRVIGLGLVGMMLVGSVLATREASVQTGGVLSSLGLIGGTVFFVMKAWMSPAGLRAAGLVPRRPLRDLGWGWWGRWWARC